MIGRAVIGAFVFALAMTPVQAAPPACPLPGQTPMLLVKMYFGQSGEARAWEQFLSGTVTPRFPGGFTVYEARGQWTDPKSKSLIRERTRVVEIAAPDTLVVRNRVADIARDYRAKFRQHSVGVVTSAACALF